MIDTILKEFSIGEKCVEVREPFESNSPQLTSRNKKVEITKSVEFIILTNIIS